MLKLHTTSHKIDTVFVAALFTVFAATAFLVVLIGAKQYQNTADSMDYNYEIRAASSYLVEKVRQNDSASHIAISELEGIPALCLTSEENGMRYITYIYCYDGALRELLVSEHSVYAPNAGQQIVPLGDFAPEAIDSGLIRITITGTDGKPVPLYLSIHTDSKERAL